ncbi:MAG: helix-turn-helix domain-containing protein [Thermoguttaceae bacterium]|jgi:DNA-binding transcriptional ArsR family regulator
MAKVKTGKAARATVQDLAKLQQTLAQKLIGLRRVIAPAGRKETEGSGEDYPIQIRASRWPEKFPWAVRAVAAIDEAWEALRDVMVCHSQVFGRRRLPTVLADRNNSGEPSVLAVLEHLRSLTELPARETALGLIDRLVGELGGKATPPVDVALTQEDKTILETLADEGMTLTQEDLANVTRLSERTVREHLKYLRKKKLVNRPRGPKKGEGITALGLSVIGRG